jgi:cysteinyl-tRNA synthetase
MELTLYDTLTRAKRAFTPLDPAHVRMYVCGPTVYDFAHIGNARPVIVFDVLFRLLRHRYGADHVTYARNITDVDDKINARAAQDHPDLPLNQAIRRVTEQTERQFHEDVAALGCLPPTIEPRATEHIAAMKELIERLVAAGSAYVAQEHVLFSVSSMPDYGRLSKRPLDEMIAGSRVEVAPYKRGPMDFVLWKPSKPGEPAWPSPAGIATPGRPGWHIECSAMAWQHLGETFDIHGGGIDLVFPHHENEIAQSRCSFHTPVMANYWLHNGFLQVDGKKMAKSEGNFITIREVLTNWKGVSWPGNAVRLAMIDSHYRQPINWTQEKLSQAELELFRFASGMLALSANVFSNDLSRFSEFILGAARVPPGEFVGALCDDLNTPAALAYVRQRYSQMDRNPEIAVEVLNALEFIGVVRREHMFLNQPPGRLRIFDRDEFENAAWLGRELTVGIRNNNSAQYEAARASLAQKSIEAKHYVLGMFVLEKALAEERSSEARISTLIDARNAARKAKNFKEADRIRDELKAMGIELEDNKDGTTTWKVKP